MENSKLIKLVIVLAIAGMAISGYLTWYAFVTSVGVCPLTGLFECSAVLTSVYSRVEGVPVALLGFLWFLVAALLGVLSARDDSWVKYLLVWSVVALAGVLRLQYVEIFIIGQICPLCTSAHTLGLCILVLSASLWFGKRS